MFDTVHERCAKFNTRRIARTYLEWVYYTILYYAKQQAKLSETILFIKNGQLCAWYNDNMFDVVYERSAH